MTEQYIFNVQIMTNTRIICWWCCWLLVLIQNINSSSLQGNTTEDKLNVFKDFSLAQFLSFCNQTINMTSPLSIIFTQNSLSYSSCCNITLIKPSLSNSSEQIIINILNFSKIIPSLQIFNKQMQSIELVHYSLFNRTYIKSDIIDLPLTFSLCQFNLQTFEILITNISKGKN
jgi:hypothetical protein